jgi:hypothetical protein
MPLKPHPTDPDKMVYVKREYNLAQPEQEPVACERCKQLEEQAYDLLGKLKVANIKLSIRSQRTWAGLMRGVRVDGDTVVIKVKNGNDAARELCGALIEEMNK